MTPSAGYSSMKVEMTSTCERLESTWSGTSCVFSATYSQHTKDAKALDPRNKLNNLETMGPTG